MVPTLPISVAAVDDYEIIVAGLADLLGQFPDRIRVADQVIVGEPVDEPVDVAMYDTYGRRGIAGAILHDLATSEGIGRVVVFTLYLNPLLIDDARAAGASGFISKALPADEIAAALVRIASGEEIVAPAHNPSDASGELDWPGKDDGLSERESEILTLVSEGLSNQEVGEAIYLSRETVKSHLHGALKKLGLRNRVEASSYVHRSAAFQHHPPTGSGLGRDRGDDQS